MEKIECIVTSQIGPRVITGLDEAGKAIRKETKRGDRVQVSSAQLQEWKHQIKPVKVFEAEMATIEAQRQADLETAKAAGSKASPLNEETIKNLTDDALKAKMAELNVTSPGTRAEAEAAVLAALKAQG